MAANPKTLKLRLSFITASIGEAHISAIDIAAELTVSKDRRQHGNYVRERFTDRDSEDGLQDNARMRRVSPVRVLERMIVPRGRETKPYLESHHIAAVNQMYILLEQTRSTSSHEIRERVDMSMTKGQAIERRLDASKRVSAAYGDLTPEAARLLKQVFGVWADHNLSLFFPNQRHRLKAKRRIRFALDDLAQHFGITS